MLLVHVVSVVLHPCVGCSIQFDCDYQKVLLEFVSFVPAEHPLVCQVNKASFLQVDHPADRDLSVLVC